MDIIPFLYLLLLPLRFSLFSFSITNTRARLLLESINILITIHACYLIYSMWQWFVFLKPYVTSPSFINWDFAVSIPVIQTVGVCLLPWLFLIPSFRRNRYGSIFVYLFVGWCYYNKINFYFFSFYKIALCVSVFITVYALRWLLYLRLNNN